MASITGCTASIRMSRSKSSTTCPRSDPTKILSAPSSPNEPLDPLELDDDFLLQGDVFTPDVIEILRLRPHREVLDSAKNGQAKFRKVICLSSRLLSFRYPMARNRSIEGPRCQRRCARRWIRPGTRFGWERLDITCTTGAMELFISADTKMRVHDD